MRDRDPTDLEAAYKAAVRVETYLRAYDADKITDTALKTSRNHDDGNVAKFRRDRRDDHRIRQVGQNDVKPIASSNETNSAVAQLCVQLEKVQREKDELSKEIGHLKLVAEQTRANIAVSKPNSALSNMQSKFPVRNDRSQFHPYANSGDVRTCFEYKLPGHIARDCAKRHEKLVGISGNMKNSPRIDEVEANKTVRGMTIDGSDEPCFLRVKVRGVGAFALLDSGSEVTVIPSNKVDPRETRPARHNLFAAIGTGITIKGRPPSRLL